MRVLHVLGGLAHSSGPTPIVLNLAAQLADRGCRVCVYHLTGRGLDSATPEDPRIRIEGFPTTWSRRWGYSIGLRGALEENMPAFDIVHVHSLWMYLNLAAARAARRYGVPYVVAPQGALDAWSLGLGRRRKQVYARLVERRLLQGAAAIQAVTVKEREDVRRFGVRAPCAVIPNGVRTQDFRNLPERAAARRRFGLQPTDRVILFLSRVHPKKGLDILLRALPGIRSNCPSARLLVAGCDRGSGHAGSMRKLADRLGVGPHVVFAGEVRAEDKRAALAAADVFALTSYSEGLPMAVLEALAAGVPAVITRACNLPEVEACGAGRVVAPDPGTAARALGVLLEDDALRTGAGKRARQLVEERFTWTSIGERLHRFYTDVCAGRPIGAETGRPCEERLNPK